MGRPVILPRAAKLLAIGALLLTAGCSSLNPFASKPAPKNLPNPLPEFQSAIAGRVVWKASVGQAGNYVFSPALARGSVYAAGSDGSVVRIDVASGQVQWTVNAGSKLTAGVGSDGSTIAVAAEKGMVMAFDETGKVRWKMQAASEVLSAPAVGQGLVVVRSLDNQITAFDAETGTRRWTTRRSLPSLVLRSAPGLVFFRQ
jgi:outer membrane protein assembly factor BamB